MQRSSFQTEVLSNSCGPLEHVGERHSSAAQGQSPDHRFHSKSIKDFLPPEKKKKKKVSFVTRNCWCCPHGNPNPPVMKLAQQLIGALRVFSLCK